MGINLNFNFDREIFEIYLKEFEEKWEGIYEEEYDIVDSACLTHIYEVDSRVHDGWEDETDDDESDDESDGEVM
jgi:hypothetical protein